MKKIKLVGVSAILGLLVVNSNNVFAQGIELIELETVNVALVASTPGEEVDVLKGKGDDAEVIGTKTLPPRKIKINNKTILKLAEAPQGSKLVLIDGSIGSITGLGADSFQEIGTVEVAEGLVVSHGQATEVDSSTDTKYKFATKSAYQSEYVATLTVAGTGLNFALTGLATEKEASSSSETDTASKSSETYSFSLNGVGEGVATFFNKETEESEDLDAIFSGKIQSSGKATANEKFVK